MRVTGCTLHVVDAGVDTGPIVAQVAVPVEEGDDEASLHERIKAVERRTNLAQTFLDDMMANHRGTRLGRPGPAEGVLARVAAIDSLTAVPAPSA